LRGLSDGHTLQAKGEAIASMTRPDAGIRPLPGCGLRLSRDKIRNKIREQKQE
jgi:hypothetical protein